MNALTQLLAQVKNKGKNYYRNLTDEQKQEKIEKNRKRLMEEKTFMKAKYDAIFNRVKSHQKQKWKHFKDIEVYKCYITWEQLWDLWERHKETHGGLFCAITGEKMTHIGVNPPGAKKYSRNWNNISIDRLDASKPYTLQNIIFVTWKINKMKNDFPISYMKKILQIYEERFKNEME